MDFIRSVFKVSLRVVFQFDLDVVQCAVLLWVSAIVFFCSTRVVNLLWFFLCSFEHGSVYVWVLLCKCCLVCCEVFLRNLQEFRLVYVRFVNVNTSVGRSSTYVKAAAGLGRFG